MARSLAASPRSLLLTKASLRLGARVCALLSCSAWISRSGVSARLPMSCAPPATTSCTGGAAEFATNFAKERAKQLFALLESRDE